MAKKRIPDWFQDAYPDWKKNLWGMGRAFVASFIPMLAICLMSATPKDFSSITSFKTYLMPILVASFTAGVVGLGKFVRDLYPESEIIQKMPI